VAVPVSFYPFVEAVFEKKHDFSADTIKVLLTNNLPDRTWAVKASVTGELSTGGGYTAGGNTASVTSSTNATGLYKLVLADPATWTASGGGFGPFRYAVFYNDTAANDELICYVDNGSSISRTAGQTFTVDLNASTGIIQAQAST
jgi:hypothetical protein